MLKYLLTFILVTSPLFGADAANDIIITQRNSGNTGNIQRNLTGTANALMGTSGSGVAVTITAGTGISIVAGVITSTAAGTGTVTSVSVVTANGVSGSVATSTTTPAITLTLGAITPTSVNGLTITTTTSGVLTIPNSVTVTGPAASGTIMTLGNAETVTGAKTYNVGKLILAGSTSGTSIINAQATAGSTTFVTPTTSGTLVGSGDTGTVTNAMLAGSIVNAKLSNSTITIGGASTALGASVTASTILDSISSTQGTILYRDAAGWQALVAGTSGFYLKTQGAGANPIWATVSGSGTVTSVSVVTANGVSGSVATSTTTPAITLTLGAITPSSVVSTGIITGTVYSSTSNANIRSSKTNFHSTINVKDYGATGDGTTDDVGAINAAVAAMTSYSELYFPPGNYRLVANGINAIDSVSYITIHGDGATITNDAGINANTMVVNPTCSYVTISGLNWVHNAASRGTGVVLRCYADRSIITNNHINGAGEFGILISNESSGVNDDSIVCNNEIISTKGDGIHAGSVENLLINANNIESTGDDAIGVIADFTAFPPGRVQITNNLIRNAGFGGGTNGCGIRVAEVTDALISNNSVYHAVESAIYVTRYLSTTAYNVRVSILGNKLNASPSISGPRAAIWVEWMSGCTISGNKIDDPAFGAGVSYLDSTDLVISNNQLRAIPVRGITSDDTTTTNVATNCYRVWIMDNQLLYILANEAIYAVAPTGTTINDIIISGNVGGSLPAGNYIYADRVNTGRIWNNLNDSSRTANVGATAPNVTLGNNN